MAETLLDRPQAAEERQETGLGARPAGGRSAEQGGRVGPRHAPLEGQLGIARRQDLEGEAQSPEAEHVAMDEGRVLHRRAVERAAVLAGEVLEGAALGPAGQSGMEARDAAVLEPYRVGRVGAHAMAARLEQERPPVARAAGGEAETQQIRFLPAPDTRRDFITEPRRGRRPVFSAIEPNRTNNRSTPLNPSTFLESLAVELRRTCAPLFEPPVAGHGRPPPPS